MASHESRRRTRLAKLIKIPPWVHPTLGELAARRSRRRWHDLPSSTLLPFHIQTTRWAMTFNPPHAGARWAPYSDRVNSAMSPGFRTLMSPEVVNSSYGFDEQ